MLRRCINFQLDRVSGCPQSGILGEKVFKKLEDVLKKLTSIITKSTEKDFLSKISADNPFAGIPELLTKEELEKARAAVKQRIDDGTLVVPELLVDTLTLQLGNVTDAFLEMLSRMEENREAVCEALTGGKLYNRIDDITLSAGDTHNNGRSVTILHTDAGKLVYKPHDMRGYEQIYLLAEKFFSKFVGIPKSIAFGKSFGVCEFIEKRPAEGKSERKKSQTYSNVKYSLHSPMSTLIMPSRIKNCELSILIDTKEEGNAPVVDGHRVMVRNYISFFKDGYHDAYMQTLAHREEIAEFVRSFPPQIPVRSVERATSIYGELLRKLYHHSAFVSDESMAQNMKTLSKLLYEGSKDTDPEIIESEIKQYP